MNMDSTTLATTSTFAPRDAVEPAKVEKLQDQKTPQEIPLQEPGSRESPVVAIIESPVERISPPKKRNAVSSKRGRSKTSPKSTYLELTKRGLSPKHHYDSALPPPIETSEVIGHQFLCHFINFFARASTKDVIFNSWMEILPKMLASQIQPSTKKSIAAASMMCYGRRTNDKVIMMEAFRSYGAGLSSQRRVLEEIVKTKRTPTIQELCTPLLMSFFEISCCTSQTAYFQHLFGAGRLMEFYGPEKCTEGILFELFHSLRLQLVWPPPFISPVRRRAEVN